jgi:hypothetical protein
MILGLMTIFKFSKQVRIHVVVFWLTTPCSLLVGCRILEEGLRCIFMVDVKMGTIYMSETFINKRQIKN